MQAQAQAAAQPVAQAQAQGVAQTAAQTAAPFAQPSAQAEPQPTAQTPLQTLEQPSKQAPELAPATTKRKKRSRPRSKPSARRMFLIALRDALIPLALVIILLQFFSPTIVREHSMENTLKENELLYIAKPAYWLASPQYGDIVVFHITTEENEVERNLVKRVIGLPGDSISISGGTVIRNGTPLEEPYLKNGTTPGEMGELTVPEDAYFVLGDNREVSNDSRNPSIGFIEKEQVYGKVILRIFPLDKFRAF
jgi:signal peptidase I